MDDPADGVEADFPVEEAAAFAASQANGAVVGTAALLVALAAADATGDWAWIELHTRSIDWSIVRQYPDQDRSPGGKWHGFDLTPEAHRALKFAAQITREYASFTTIPVGIFAVALIHDRGNGAARALMHESGLSHDELVDLFQDALLGIRLQGLSALLVNLGSNAKELSQQATIPVNEPLATADSTSGPDEVTKRGHDRGFRMGTFLGAFILTVVGGTPIFLALGFAWLARTVAKRVRRHPLPQQLMTSVSALGLVVATILAITAAPNLTDDRLALASLTTARQAIESNDLETAMKSLADASLRQPDSVAARLLGACVDWDLRFRDLALAELQIALNLGYRPGEPSGYRGRDCFVDQADFHGVGFLSGDEAARWLVYARPHTNDAVSQRYLELAIDDEARDTGEALIALGCLADRYDLRYLASFGFTVGIAQFYHLQAGPGSRYSEIQKCIAAIKTRYKVVPHAPDEVATYVPADLDQRIPSSERMAPLNDPCWARFPLVDPCVSHD